MGIKGWNPHDDVLALKYINYIKQNQWNPHNIIFTLYQQGTYRYLVLISAPCLNFHLSR